VKLVVEEVGSDLAAALWDSCDRAMSSRLAYPEVRAALAAAGRNHDLDAGDLAEAERTWERLWSTMWPIELTEQVERRSGDLAKQHGMRGADAVHLASMLVPTSTPLVVAAWDLRLRRGCVAERLALAPPA